MHITDSETLFIQRRRLGVSQKARAEQLNISEWQYTEYEQDRQEVPKGIYCPKGMGAVSAYADPLTKIEELTLKRRRNGWTQQEVADDIGCSRLWVIRMESGTANPALLYDYWS